MESPRTFIDYYAGQGTPSPRKLEGHREPPEEKSPQLYLADAALRNAVNVAIMLGQPFLITGLPGTGKTQLAHSIAWELGLKLEVFHAKTTSVARDLFYRYDALRHFHAVHEQVARRQAGGAAVVLSAGEVPEARNFIHVESVGRAILRASRQDFARAWLPADERHRAPSRSVVLIDEIDKAPRDLPNDVLNEFEAMEFSMDEVPEPDSYRADPEFRPILILTSNSEKNLPDAFLRRCIFFHIDPPDQDRLRTIVRRRLGLADTAVAPSIDHAIVLFHRISKIDGLKKTPATGECIAWAEVLAARGIDLSNAEHLKTHAEFIHSSICVIGKSPEDLHAMRRLLPVPASDGASAS